MKRPSSPTYAIPTAACSNVARARSSPVRARSSLSCSSFVRSCTRRSSRLRSVARSRRARASRMWVATRARTTRPSNGTVTKSTAPTSKPRTLSASSWAALMNITGTPAVRLSAFSRRQSSKPSRPGIRTSSSTRSGGASSAEASATSGLPIGRTSYPSDIRSCDMRLRLSGVSSTTRISPAGAVPAPVSCVIVVRWPPPSPVSDRTRRATHGPRG